MNGATSHTNTYRVPTHKLGLNGPVAKPAPGTLPLRGDLAHIALAGTHLAAHYAIPTSGMIKNEATALRALPRDDAEITGSLEPGARIEVLDIGSSWIWCCLGPEGPSGYVHVECVDLSNED